MGRAVGNPFPLKFVCGGVARHASEAVEECLKAVPEDRVVAAGIDAPLFWQPNGGRAVDRSVRRAITDLGANSGTVNDVNSLRGACLVQGMMTAMLLRQTKRKLPITESHPKALLWLINLANPDTQPKDWWADLGDWIQVCSEVPPSEHVRDAVLGGISAFAMVTKMEDWRNLVPDEIDPIHVLSPPPEYWLPGIPAPK